jgi:hypothetical protein
MSSTSAPQTTRRTSPSCAGSIYGLNPVPEADNLSVSGEAASRGYGNKYLAICKLFELKTMFLLVTLRD